jgi:hypothetical protein
MTKLSHGRRDLSRGKTNTYARRTASFGAALPSFADSMG